MLNHNRWSFGTNLLIVVIVTALASLCIGTSVQAQDEANTTVESAEVTFELSYASQIQPHLAIHPDIQYVANPATYPSLKSGLLWEASF